MEEQSLTLIRLTAFPPSSIYHSKHLRGTLLEPGAVLSALCLVTHRVLRATLGKRCIITPFVDKETEARDVPPAQLQNSSHRVCALSDDPATTFHQPGSDPLQTGGSPQIFGGHGALCRRHRIAPEEPLVAWEKQDMQSSPWGVDLPQMCWATSRVVYPLWASLLLAKLRGYRTTLQPAELPSQGP